MFNKTINVDAKPDWETYYPPELVGKYLTSIQPQYLERGEVIKMSPGMMFAPIEQPSLDGFLRWCATKPRPKAPKPLNRKKGDSNNEK